MFGQKFTISGYFKDKSNGEGLIGATAYIRELGRGVVSNAYGFYSISAPKGSYTIVYSFIGYKPITQTINLTQNQYFDIKLETNAQQM
jgi:hypothetical protein